jgi:hypothetical protein
MVLGRCADVLQELKSRSWAWVWCSRCEQAFQAKYVRVSVSYGEELYFCPYSGCNGSLLDFTLGAKK